MTETSTTYACPVCGTVHTHQDQRYKNYVCQDCEKRATCSHERPVVGYNTGPFGGFEARHYDRGDNRCDQVTADHRVWIDGVEFRMNEARFGGIVVTPVLNLPSVRETLVWETHGLSDYTVGGEPGPFYGGITEVPGRRRIRQFFRREPSTWTWQVWNASLKKIVREGAANSRDAAKDRVIEALDYANRLLHQA